GARNFAMRIWLDPVRMASHNVTAKDISDAVNNSNFLASPGSTKSQLVAVAVDTDTTLKTPEAFAQLPIRGAGDSIVRLGDVAHVELGTDDDTVRTSFNGREGVFIGVFPTPSANPLTTAGAIRDMLPSLKTELPEGMDVITVFDSTVFIQASIDEV